MKAEASSSTTTEQEALRALTFQRLHPKAYLERFLAEKVRPDGRETNEWRGVSVNVGSISTADGSALVRLGNTTVVCGVKAEIAEPELDRPEHGFLGVLFKTLPPSPLKIAKERPVPNLDLPAICSPKFKPGPPSEEAQVLSDRLNEVLIASGLLSTTSLCIEPGKAVWVLYVDATCINYDGNAFDATLLAMVAALKNNPTAFEEPLLDTTISIAMSDSGELISVMQLGLGSAGDQDVLSQCLATAAVRCKETTPIMKLALCKE
ncbi:hypothetical protein PHLCEN_2v7445 [Hermanssonia centrifuga]|uniref:Ribosomal RNA-processing protein 43 n=1 Tax=Hermanssonia centrifuga TaxID=98765 RepID=A0A2R6NX45_9APHY|nr:hypothetical protein PHLCEN_2v7445 [Hermanssonia centrifuga]